MSCHPHVHGALYKVVKDFGEGKSLGCGSAFKIIILTKYIRRINFAILRPPVSINFWLTWPNPKLHHAYIHKHIGFVYYICIFGIVGCCIIIPFLACTSLFLFRDHSKKCLSFSIFWFVDRFVIHKYSCEISLSEAARTFFSFTWYSMLCVCVHM